MHMSRFRLVAAAALAGVIMSIGVAAPARAESSYGTLRGDIIDPDGWMQQGLAQIRTTRLSDGEVGWDTFRGGYSLVRSPGRYLVEARFECKSSGGCIQNLYAGNTPYRSQAQIVTVTADTETFVNFTTRRGGSISGTVADATGGDLSSLAAQAHLVDPVTNSLTSWSVRASVASNGSYRIAGVPAGDYLVRFIPGGFELAGAEYWNEADWIADAELVSVGDESVEVTNIDGSVGAAGVYAARYSGADRFAMAVGISQEYASGVGVVFVTNGLNFPDALSAGPLGAAYGGPILLVTPTSVPAVVAAELERLDPDTILVVGGVNSVGPAVYDQLATYASHIERIAGADRFAASRNLISAGFDEAETVYVATGHNFPDALAAGAAASFEHAPVLLVDGHASTVDVPTAELLGQLGTSRIVVVGGPASVPASYLASLAALPAVSEVARLSGADRFLAASGLNEATFPVADVVFLATGMNFPDALAGGPLAGAWCAPIYLVQKNCVPMSVISEIVRLQPHQILVLGGPASVGDEVMGLVACGA